jgi:nicotinamidase/pyrazinamidase
VNRYAGLFASRSLPVFATRDWHPPNHCSFAAQGGSWPVHCVAGTPGAEFSSQLELPGDAHIISKATEPAREAYSDFSASDFDERLRQLAVRRLFVGGLATEYCVLATVRDAITRGYKVVLLVDAIRSIEVQPGDGRRAIDEMSRLGAVPASWEDIENPHDSRRRQ